MFRLLKLSVLGAGTFYGYYKLTKFETNITIKNEAVTTCLFEKVDRHVVTTDKGKFVVKIK